MLLHVDGITKSYGNKILFEKLSIYIERKDKIGIIGLNGSGKSTILKIIAGIVSSEEGSIKKDKLTRISYLSQELDLISENTVYEEVLRSVGDSLIDFEEYEAKAILTKLELTAFDKQVKFLSGGEKRRLAIACAIIRPADLLILDEITNHLDTEIILWLEKYLIKYNAAILMVTHDRYFLERVVNKILELDNGKFYEYEANYSRYLELKLERSEYAEASSRKKSAYLRSEFEWIKRGPRARGTKSKNRIENFEKLSSEKELVQKNLTITSVASRLGNKTIEFDNVSKSFDKLLFKNFTHNLANDARLGITGKNGVGKSTLFKLITEEISPDVGKIEIGSTVKIGHFSQENIELDPDLRLIEYIKGIKEFINNGSEIVSASQMLENFLFDNPYEYIKNLSGGEKRRLLLVSVLMMEPNVLLLDEPTNDLDISTLNVLESFIDVFNGAVLIISHDRYFLDRTIDRFFVLEEDKLFHQYLGKYSDYLESITKETTIDNLKETKTIVKKKENQTKLTFKEQLEYEKIEDDISDIESKITDVNLKINNYIGDYNLQKPFLDKQEELEKELESLLDRWEYLSEIALKSK
jgi:ATP-binding cassette subfamily F protein uup